MVDDKEFHKLILGELLDIRNLAEIGSSGLLDGAVDSVSYVTLFELIEKKADKLSSSLDEVSSSVVAKKIKRKVSLVDVSNV